MRWKTYALVFLATAVAGLAVRMYGQDIVVELFGEGWFILAFLAPRLILPAFVAAVVGYVLPRGFFLWGLAVIFLHPLVEAFSINRALKAGVIESSELGGLILVELMILIMLMLACTVAAALGAGLRLLWWRLRGESIRDRLGISAGSSDLA